MKNRVNRYFDYYQAAMQGINTTKWVPKYSNLVVQRIEEFSLIYKEDIEIIDKREVENDVPPLLIVKLKISLEEEIILYINPYDNIFLKTLELCNNHNLNSNLILPICKTIINATNSLNTVLNYKFNNDEKKQIEDIAKLVERLNINDSV
jgi:hypothetical protein